MGTKTFTYTFLDGATTDTINLNVSTPSQATSNGTGYIVNSVTGSIGGTAITGEVGSGGVKGTVPGGGSAVYDNTVFASDTAGGSATESDGVVGSKFGIDDDGIEFKVNNTEYNLFYETAFGYNGFELYNTNSSASNLSLVSSNAPCYCTGTLIRTARGDVAVEDLAVDELVVTASGAHRPIRWIGHRAFAERFANNNSKLLPIRVKAGALADGVPARDLRVSPKHALFLDGALFPAETLVNGVSVIKETRVDELAYWHVELDSHDVLIAEGAPAESYLDDDNRMMFHNAPTFHALYPDVGRPEAIYCAQRFEDGFELEAVRRRIAARAGLTVADCGGLRGLVDMRDDHSIGGWAQNPSYPDAPVCLDVLVDDALVAQILANDARADLDAAVQGHAFLFQSADSLVGRTVAVRRSLDQALLADVAYSAVAA